MFMRFVFKGHVRVFGTFLLYFAQPQALFVCFPVIRIN